MESVVLALRRASVRIHSAIAEDAASLMMGGESLPMDASGRPAPLSEGMVMNASGDKVCALDVQSDLIVEEELRACAAVSGYASEERRTFVPLNAETGRFVVVCDPLDGSQNVPVGVSVGAIYGIFKAKTLSDIKSGNDMVAAGYALFSACLQFVWAEDSVSMSMYKPSTREWIATASGHQIPPKGKTYSINEGSAKNWNIDVATFVEQHLRGRSVRWAACMVLDVHRNLVQGGCFIYPTCKKYTKGRLRLVYEAYPMAFVWEKAGGVALAVAGKRILDAPFPADDVHARSGVILLGEWEAAKFEEAQATVKETVDEWGKY